MLEYRVSLLKKGSGSDEYSSQAKMSWRWEGREVRAMVFDVDGTLYPQGPLRRAMMLRLARAYWHSPLEGWTTLLGLRAYRREQERLRLTPSAGVDQKGTEAIRRWMEDEPLAFLRPLVYEGLAELLAAAKSDGLKLGVFSDYPAEKKLRTMELDKYFDVVVSAQDPEVQRFKPDPRGLEITLGRMGISNSDAVYVGDRADVDGAAAAGAGMRCAILGDYKEIMRLMCLPK